VWDAAQVSENVGYGYSGDTAMEMRGSCASTSAEVAISGDAHWHERKCVVFYIVVMRYQ
jgi:hypothetical protein